MKSPNRASRPAKSPQAHSPRTFGLNLRAQVIQTLAQVVRGQSLSVLLPALLDAVTERDRALAHELVLGSCRQWFALSAVLAPMVSQTPNPIVEAALICGSYQLAYTRIPPHAAMSETIDAVRQLNQPQAAGFVNAVLRRFQRELSQLSAQLDQHSSLPEWLSQQLLQDWPDQASALAETLRGAAPIFLRVNRRQYSRAHYLELLGSTGIEAEAISTPDGIRLQQSVSITQLPGYVEGWFSVQDANAQLAASLLGNLDGKVVLDACAAPGGKTAHVLEWFQPESLTALDADPIRLKRVEDTVQRLNLTELCPITYKATNAATWPAPQPFDAILLDAPCTATGVLRRHPDIRLLRQPTDVIQTIALQKRLLDHLWLMLKPGGVLVYVTCSLLKAENETQIADFLARTPDARELLIDEHWGETRPNGRQCFPTADGGDGFYYARLIKHTAPV